MARDKLKAALESKGPDALRQAAVGGRQVVQPVDIISASIPAERKEDRENRTEKPNYKIEVKKSSQPKEQVSERKRRSKKPQLKSEQDIHALLASDKRATERYSFEIYTDQKDDIALLCERYEKSTTQKLSASRFIREVLDYFLPGALKAFEEENG